MASILASAGSVPKTFSNTICFAKIRLYNTFPCKSDRINQFDIRHEFMHVYVCVCVGWFDATKRARSNLPLCYCCFEMSTVYLIYALWCGKTHIRFINISFNIDDDGDVNNQLMCINEPKTNHYQLK